VAQADQAYVEPPEEKALPELEKVRKELEGEGDE
jgi:hypothetical protein